MEIGMNMMKQGLRLRVEIINFVASVAKVREIGRNGDGFGAIELGSE